MVRALTAVPYCDLPIPETSIVRLHAAAVARGVDAATPQEATVLEVGCANGVNLCAMAARHPGADFVGVDLDARAIATARARAQACGLSNLRFVHADFAHFESGLEANGASFDYVIAHGVYSWVDAEHRAALLALLGRRLRPHGVGYVSYNALPGASIRLTLGELLRKATDERDDVGTTTRKMRDALEQLRVAPSGGAVPDAVLLDELDTLAQQPDAYLHHEFLSDAHTAWSVAEFCEAAGVHGLQYLADLSSSRLSDSKLEELRDHCESMATSTVQAESLLDTATFRAFRATLVVRSTCSVAQDVRVARPALVSTEVPEFPRVHAWTRFEAEALGFVTSATHHARAVHPLHAALVEASDGTRSRDALVAFVRARVEAGEIVLPNASGEPASAQEVAAGLTAVVDEALEQLASGGLFVID